MKNFIILIFLIFLIISCKIDEYPTYILAGQSIGSGIVYIDVVPDDTLKIIDFPDKLEVIGSLDLDHDKINDFELTLWASSPWMLGAWCGGLEIKPLGLNALCVSGLHTYWVEPLKMNDTINQNRNWSDTTALLYSYCQYIGQTETTSHGYWYNQDHLYVGIKIVKGNHQFFGWIDLKGNVIRQYGITIPYRD